jgi:hypothetical protein
LDQVSKHDRVSQAVKCFLEVNGTCTQNMV